MIQRVLALSLVAACLLLAGCSTGAEKPAAQAVGGMGGGMGGSAGGSGEPGASSGMVEGFVASPANCILEVGSGSRDSSDGVSVSRVVAPADGWVVLSSSLAPGRVLGKTWVPKGENRDVLVKLTAADGPRAIVSFHVDRGEAQLYEFDPERPIRSSDAQVFVARAPVESPVTLTGFGADVLANSALLAVDNQPARGSSVTVAYLLTPGPSWISVMAVDDGVPRLLGRTWRAAGEYQQVVVPLEEAAASGDVLVTVHQDAGIRNRFEYEPSDPLGSQDQPYRAAGEIAIKEIRLDGK